LNIANNYSALILAAGLSERMGNLKPFLKTRCGKSFLEYLVEGFTNFGIKHSVVVLNQEGAAFLFQNYASLQDRITVVINPEPQKGRFSSIKLGLKALGYSNPVFLHNTDTPYLSQEILNQLITGLDGFEIATPVFEAKGGHPVLISPKVARKITEHSATDCNFKEFLKQFSQNRMEVDDKNVLLNINTPGEYSAYLQGK
jgi:molybdenum cofactor cytidylyltransferase